MNFTKHKACIYTNFGWVDVDNKNKKSINCIVHPLHDNILNSPFYKNKEGIFWPKVKKIDNYKSKTSNKAISYYDTQYISNILRYPEFTPEQFKEALLFLCDICEYCHKHGYWIRTHLWNVTFVKSLPFLIDIRDFEILRSQNWVSIFRGHFKDKLDSHCPVPCSNFINNYIEISEKIGKCKNNLQTIREIINKINPKKYNKGTWSSYHGNRIDFLTTAIKFDNNLVEQIKHFVGGSGENFKSVNLFKLIDEIKPKNIIEMGCNNGLYTFVCSTYGPSIGIDYDKNAINQANILNKKFKTNCTFLHFDLLDEKKLNEAFGNNGCYGNVTERFKSELLIAPAIIHHLFNQCKSTDKIIKIFTLFCYKYMIIEQIPNTVSEKSLLSSLKKYNWDVIKELASTPFPRKWLLCIKN